MAASLAELLLTCWITRDVLGQVSTKPGLKSLAGRHFETPAHLRLGLELWLGAVELDRLGSYEKRDTLNSEAPREM